MKVLSFKGAYKDIREHNRHSLTHTHTFKKEMMEKNEKIKFVQFCEMKKKTFFYLMKNLKKKKNKKI